MDAKTTAIIAHITIVGWVIALVTNSSEKDEYASYYIRQTLGLMIMAFLSFIPFVGWVVGIAAIIFWVLSVINAASGEMKPLPVVGDLFQDWFKGI